MARNGRGYYSGRSHRGGGSSSGSSGGGGDGCGFILLALAVVFFWKQILCVLAIGAAVVGIIYCLIRFHREIFYGIGAFFRGLWRLLVWLWRLLVWLWSLCFGHGNTTQTIEIPSATVIDVSSIHDESLNPHQLPHSVTNNDTNQPCAQTTLSESPLQVVPQPFSAIPKEISLKLPTTVKDLAMALNVTADAVIIKLMAMGVFVVLDQNIELENIEKVCAQYGTRFSIMDDPTFTVPTITVEKTKNSSVPSETIDSISISRKKKKDKAIPASKKKKFPSKDAESRLDDEKSRDVLELESKNQICAESKESCEDMPTVPKQQIENQSFIRKTSHETFGDGSRHFDALDHNKDDILEQIEPDSYIEPGTNEYDLSAKPEEILCLSSDKQAEMDGASTLLTKQADDKLNAFQMPQSAAQDNVSKDMPITPPEVLAPRKKKKSPFWR